MAALQVLERLRHLGFNFLTLPRYEKHVVAERGGFAALLEYTPAGEIRQFSAAGYLIENQLGVLVERSGLSVFVAKQTEVPVTPELLEALARFKQDLSSALELNRVQ